MDVRLHERFKVITLGCKVNLEESERLSDALRSLGLREAESSEADIIFVNSCVVTANAERKTRAVLRKLLEETEAHVVLMGCAVPLKGELPEWLDELRRGFEHRLFLINNLEKERWLRELEAESSQPELHRGRPLIKVQEGCDRMCSYCIVSYRRGLPRSVPEDEVLRRAIRIHQVRLERGFSHTELTLVGTNISLWGRDMGLRLEDLLEVLLARAPEEISFRLSSLDPKYVSTRLLRMMEQWYPRLRPHLHLSLQSASDKVLTDMRREHRRRDLDAILDSLSSLRIKVGLTADVIVGFPTEGEREFEETYTWLSSAFNLHRLHVFKYSPRAGTVAYQLYGREVSLTRQRYSELIELSRELSRRYIVSREGDVLQAVLDLDDESRLGYTEDYLRVRLRGEVAAGELLSVKLLSPWRPSGAIWIGDAEPAHATELSSLGSS